MRYTYFILLFWPWVVQSQVTFYGSGVGVVSAACDFDLASATFTDDESISTQSADAEGMFIGKSGLKLYLADRVGDAVDEYDLSPAWDVSTSVYVRTLSINTYEAEISGLTFKEDGTKMFIVGYDGDEVNEFTLSTAWNISTATQDAAFSVSTQEITPQDVRFSPNGETMFIIGSTGDDVNEYDVPVPWTFSTTPTYTQNFSVSTQENTPLGFDFSNDGKKVYIIGDQADDISEFRLPTAWSLSGSPTFVQNFDVSGKDILPRDVKIRDGSIDNDLYFLGATSDKVYEYAVGCIPLCDASWRDISLMLHMDGTDEGTTFTDDSKYGNTTVANGNVNTETATFKFGTASAQFDGTGDYISIADTEYGDEFDFGTGDFTVELWVYFNNFTATDFGLIMEGKGSDATGPDKMGWGLYTDNSGDLLVFEKYDGTTSTLKSATWNPSDSTWYHVAVSRNGVDLRFFVDGTQIGSTANVSGVDYDNQETQVQMGMFHCCTGAIKYFDGYMDDVRVTKGIGRYTANFTAPTAPYVDCQSDEVVQSELVSSYDATKAAYSTTWDDLTGSYDGTFQGNASDDGTYIDFDGTGDYVDYTNSIVGTGDKTISMYLYPEGSHKNWSVLIENCVGLASTNSGVDMYYGSDGKVTFNIGNGAPAAHWLEVVSSSTLTVGAWDYLTFLQKSSDAYIYFNGIEDASDLTTNGSEAAPDNNMIIARRNSPGGSELDGRVSNFELYSRALTDNEIAYNYDIITGWSKTDNLLLDDYSANIEVAYSLRKLDKDYTGACIEIERTSDNEKHDIYFIGEHLDDVAIEAFCSGTTCRVRTWYDQDGTANNAVQTTHTKQPTIYTGSAVVTLNNKSAMDFDAVDEYLTLGTASTAEEKSMALVAERVSSGSSLIAFCGTVGGSVNPVYTLYWTTDNIMYAATTLSGYAQTDTITSTGQFIIYTNDQQNDIYLDNVQKYSSSPGATRYSTMAYIGRYEPDGASDYSDGKMQEIIMWNADKDSDRTSIYNNQDAYWRP